VAAAEADTAEAEDIEFSAAVLIGSHLLWAALYTVETLAIEARHCEVYSTDVTVPRGCTTECGSQEANIGSAAIAIINGGAALTITLKYQRTARQAIFTWNVRRCCAYGQGRYCLRRVQ